MYLPGTEMETQPGVRPSIGHLMSVDLLVIMPLVTCAVFWVLYFVIELTGTDFSDGEGISTAEVFLLIAMLESASAVALGTWRYRYYSAMVTRGVEAKAKIISAVRVSDGFGFEYVFVLDGKEMKGQRGVGGMSPKKRAEALVGREIRLLVDPEKPTRVLILDRI